MKKIIITVMAIIMMMSLVSCGEEEPVKPVLSPEGEEEIITETIITENIIEEDVIYEDIIFEGNVYKNVPPEVREEIRAYEEGRVSKEAVEELLFNSQSNDW